jgi:hypothetical protein
MRALWLRVLRWWHGPLCWSCGERMDDAALVFPAVFDRCTRCGRVAHPTLWARAR